MSEQINCLENVCKKCGGIFPLTSEYFHRDKYRKNGFKNYCKACLKHKSTNYYETNKDKRRESQRKYNAENKDKIKEYYKEYCATNKDKVEEYRKKYRDINKDKIKEYHKEYDKKYRNIKINNT